MRDTAKREAKQKILHLRAASKHQGPLIEMHSSSSLFINATALLSYTLFLNNQPMYV